MLTEGQLHSVTPTTSSKTFYKIRSRLQNEKGKGGEHCDEFADFGVGSLEADGVVSYYRGWEERVRRQRKQYGASILEDLKEPREGACQACVDNEEDAEMHIQRSAAAQRLRELLLQRSNGPLSTSPCRKHNRSIMAAESSHELLRVFQKYSSGFDGCNLSTLMSRLAKLAEVGDKLELQKFDGVLETINNRLHEFAMRHICNTTWAMGKLSLRSRATLETITRLVTERYRE
eukprot:3165054-Amphidinium_carterae.1